MLIVEKIKRVASGFDSYPESIRKELLTRFGCDGSKGNFIIEGQYHNDLIKEIRDFISSNDGMFRVYKLWYCRITNKWRLVYGYE